MSGHHREYLQKRNMSRNFRTGGSPKYGSSIFSRKYTYVQEIVTCIVYNRYIFSSDNLKAMMACSRIER